MQMIYFILPLKCETSGVPWNELFITSLEHADYSTLPGQLRKTDVVRTRNSNARLNSRCYRVRNVALNGLMSLRTA